MKDKVAVSVTGLLYYGERLGLVEAGQVEEVGVLPEGVKDSARAPFYVCRGEDGDAILGEGLGERGAAVVVFLRGDAGRYWKGRKLFSLLKF